MNSAAWLESYHRNRRRWWAVAAGLLALLVISARIRTPRQDADGNPMPTFEVQRGPLTISISQAGTIRAMEQEIISSEVEGQTTLIYLIEEGTRVAEGDLLVQLDDSALKDNLVEQQIRVQNAEAAYIRARESLAVSRNQVESDIALAELNFRFAQEDLSQYIEGQYKQQLREADSAITLAEEELQLAIRKLEWSEKLFKENYLAQSEREADQLAHNRAKLDLELAQAAKDLLEDFTHKRQVAQFESDVEQTRSALERAKLKASADIVQAEAELKAKEAEWRQQQSKEEKVRDQIAKARITAPRDGLVVYETSVHANWRGNNEPLEAGQSVRERQELIYLPTAELMMAEVQLHESNLDLIRIGLPVVITIDALRGLTLVGHVARIAPLPDAASMWMNPDLKVYRTEIEIEGRQPDLRTGMSCMAEVVVDRYEDAVFVPVQAVVKVKGTPSAYVRKLGRFVPTPVEVGLDNNRMIRILSGLEPGQSVLLTPPLEQASIMNDQGPGSSAIEPEKLKSLIKNANGKTPPSGVQVSGNAGEHAPQLTEEQRKEMRRKFESMTPEQRREMMKKAGGGQGGREGAPRGGHP